MLDNSSTIL